MDIMNLAQQLEVQRKHSPQAALQLIQVYEQILERLHPDKDAPNFATVQANLGNVYLDLPLGDRGDNLKHAIACYQEALRVWTLETFPFEYASTQGNLGVVYISLLKGVRAANLEKAIVCFQEALRVWSPETFPFEYAANQANLGAAYNGLPTGDRTANLTHAIACYQEALRIWTADNYPIEYARTQTNLGTAYQAMRSGDRTANLTKAIACFQEALRFRTPETDRFGYARTQHNLGGAYGELLTGDRTANLTKAIACFQEALRFRTPETDRFGYARTQSDLGTAYRDLPTGDRTANLTKAIACFQEALRFRTPETAPHDYALTQIGLGSVYNELLSGDRRANLKQAIICFQEALRFLTPETDPFAYATIQTGLGFTYLNLPTADRKVNLSIAITSFQEALRFHTPETAPLDYARTQNMLGMAYRASHNLRQAIECFQEALRFRTPKSTPLDYAHTQNNLGMAYSELTIGDRATNLKLAIKCYQEALRFWTPETVPINYAIAQNNTALAYSNLLTSDHEADLTQVIKCYQEARRFLTLETSPSLCRTINYNLADLYFVRGEWLAAFDAYHIAIDAGERLYQAGLSAESKAIEMKTNASLYCQAAFSSVRCGQTEQALLLLERGKTRVLAEALHLRIARPINVPDEIWLAFELAGAAVRTTQTDEATLYEQGPNLVQPSTTREQAARDANATLETAIERVRIYDPTFLRPIDVTMVREILPDEHTAIIAFSVTNQGSIAFVVSHLCDPMIQVVEIPTFTRDKLRHLFAEADADNMVVSGWLGDYLHYLNTTTLSALTKWQRTITRTLVELGQQLLDPIMFELPVGIERIIFLPSAELFLFPLHAIPFPFLGQDLGRLCDHFQVNYAPSLEILANTRTKAITGVVPGLYSVINPQFNAKLPFASIEGEAIAKLFNQYNIDEGQAGTKQRVIAGMQGQTYVHFSCHGSYDWNYPSFSGLELADGRLTLADLQHNKVALSSTRLISLSACETGISDVLKGSAEEYVGIPAGFLLAGVPCIVSSLWSVPDFSTALLMERFYRNHLKDGMDVVAALREAQVWVSKLKIGEVADYARQWYRESQQKNRVDLFKIVRYCLYLAKQNPLLCPFAHPYYWAAFTVNGL